MGAAAPGQIATEDFYDPNTHNPRKATENAGAAAADRGVNVSVVRLAQVHNTVKQGFVSSLTRVVREKGVSAYIGNGTNRWAAVHVLDTARLYRLVLEKYEPGARYNAVAEEGRESSNFRTCWESEGWVTPSCSAARVNVPARATATK